MSTRLPQRIQRKRTRGWKMPEGAVNVARPTRWGNPFVVGDLVKPYVYGGTQTCAIKITNELAVALYREALRQDLGTGLTVWADLHLHELRGKDLACWCPLSEPCHADVLLEIANWEAE